jgi:4-amino-4-deoxy-L-arabinose transferase-like glycosyltransferase
MTNRIKTALPWIMLVLVLIVSFWLRERHLWSRGLTYDEGHWLMFALLANAGYPAYIETFVGIPPVALLILQLGTFLFGTSIAVRYPMMILSLVGVASIFWLFRPQKSTFGLVAGLLAALFLSFQPLYLAESAKIMAESSAVGMSLLSLVLAQQYKFERKAFWLVLSGMAFAVGLAIKVFVIFLPVLIGLILLQAALADSRDSRPRAARQLVTGGGVWLIGALIPLVIAALVYQPVAMYQQVLAFRFSLREISLSQGLNLLHNTAAVLQKFVEYGPLILVAVLGAVMGWQKRRADVYTWLTWLILATILLIWQIPLRTRYFIMVLPALAALNALFVTICIVWLYRRPGTPGVRLSRAALALLLTGLVAWVMVQPVKSALPPFLDTSNYVFDYLTIELRDAIDQARNNTMPDDCLITDDQRFAMAAERLVPPGLSETSDARLMTGWMISAGDIIDEAQTNNCPLVVYKFRRFRSHLPGLADELRNLYFLEIAYTPEIVIFMAQKNVTREPDILFDARLGEAISLRGIDLAVPPWQAGQQVQLATYWTALEPPERAYKIFLQLRNDRDETVATYDHFPFPVPGYRYRFLPETGGQYRITPHIDAARYSAADIAVYPAKGMVPTTIWPVGDTLREVTTLPLPESLSTGTYHLYLGLYDPDTSVRLPVHNGLVESDELLLQTIEVTGPN